MQNKILESSYNLLSQALKIFAKMKNNATLLIDACLGKYSYFSLKIIKLICNGFIIVIFN